MRKQALRLPLHSTMSKPKCCTCNLFYLSDQSREHLGNPSQSTSLERALDTRWRNFRFHGAVKTGCKHGTVPSGGICQQLHHIFPAWLRIFLKNFFKKRHQQQKFAVKAPEGRFQPPQQQFATASVIIFKCKCACKVCRQLHIFFPSFLLLFIWFLFFTLHCLFP